MRMSGKTAKRLQQIKRKRWKQQSGHCIHCGVEMIETSKAPLHPQLRGRMVTIEHLIPRWMGGADDERNVWLACLACNLSRNEGFWGGKGEAEHVEGGGAVLGDVLQEAMAQANGGGR